MHLNKGWAMKKNPCITIVKHLTMHLPTYIVFPHSSLVCLANYAIPTSIIVKLHFATLPPCNTHIVFPKNFIGFLANYATPTNGSWNVHYCINQLCNICIPTCFPNSKFAYMWILHVWCSTCGFDIIPMWVLHFEVKGPPKVNLN